MLPIIHVDMNAFYASCHQSVDPSLKGKPILVAGDPKKRNGIILTASYEARKFGVKTAMLNWQAKRLCPNAIFIRPDHKLYDEISRQVMKILGQFTPNVEIFSIDEAWLDVTGCESLFGNSIQIAHKIQDTIKKKLDISCSIGVSYNKLVAKMASDMKKPGGITVITKEDVSKKLWPLPVEKLFGVGRQMTKRLKNINVNYIGDLAKVPIKLLEDSFGINGKYLHMWANGIDNTPVDPNSRAKAKSMGHSTTLPENVTSYDKAKKIILLLSEEVGRRVRRKNYMGRTVTLTLRDSYFNTITRSTTISYTNTTDDIYDAAKGLLYSHWDENTPLRLIGVSLSQLTKAVHQISIFDEDEKKQKLNKVIDKIKDRFGEGAIFRAKFLEDINKSGAKRK